MSEYVEFTSKIVLCRKSHECCWCAQAVKKGEKSNYREYIFDGQWNHSWMHLECYDAMMATPVRDLYDGWTPGDFLRGTQEWA